MNPCLATAIFLSLFVFAHGAEKVDYADIERATELDEGLIRQYDSIVRSSRKARNDKVLAYQYAKSCYAKAVVESQQGATTASFSHLMSALEVMERITGRFGFARIVSKDFECEHLIAQIYNQLAMVFADREAWGLAAECVDVSNESYKIEGNMQGVVANFMTMGDIFLAQFELKEALAYYQKADSICSGTNFCNGLCLSSLMANSLRFFLERKTDTLNSLLHFALENCDGEIHRQRIRYMLGCMYYSDQQMDSALFNFERSFPLQQWQTFDTYSYIIQICNRLGDSEKAAFYGGLLSESFLKKAASASEKTKHIVQFQRYKDKKLGMRHKETLLFIIFIVVLLSALVIIDSVFLERRKRRHRRDKEQHEEVKASLEAKVQRVLGVFKQKDDKIKELEKELNKSLDGKEMEALSFDEKINALKNIPICKRVMLVTESNVKSGATYPELVLSDHQMTQLVGAVDKVFAQFSVKMVEKYPRLKRSDIIYCCMYILGVTEIQSAALTGKTYQAVWMRSTKLHQIFGSRSNLQFVLHDILRNWEC